MLTRRRRLSSLSASTGKLRRKRIAKSSRSCSACRCLSCKFCILSSREPRTPLQKHGGHHGSSEEKKGLGLEPLCDGRVEFNTLCQARHNRLQANETSACPLRSGRSSPSERYGCRILTHDSLITR